MSVKDHLEQFLQHDGQVLSFYGYWDDRENQFGFVHNLVLHYFLGDDTIEIKEVVSPDSFFEKGFMFCSRAKLRKAYGDLPDFGHDSPYTVLNVVSSAGFGTGHFIEDSMQHCSDNDSAFYRDTDLSIGACIKCYSRTLVLTDCNEFTKDYYRAKYGIDDFTPEERPSIHEKRYQNHSTSKRNPSQERVPASREHSQKHAEANRERCQERASANKEHSQEHASANRERSQEHAAANRECSQEHAAANRERSQDHASANREHSQKRASANRERSQEHATANRECSQEHASVNKERSREHASANRELPQEHASVNKERSREHASANRELPQEHASANKKRSQEHASANKKRSQEHASANKGHSQEHASANKGHSQEHASANKEHSQEHASANKERSQEHASANKERSQEHASANRELPQECPSAKCDVQQAHSVLNCYHQQDSSVSNEDRHLPAYHDYNSSSDPAAKSKTVVPTSLNAAFGKCAIEERQGPNDYILRFRARLVSKDAQNNANNKERIFVISYYLSDGTLSVFETVMLHTGFRGGLFARRSKVAKPGQDMFDPKYYKQDDLYVGNVLVVNGFSFEIVAADEYAMNYMEANSSQYPKSDISLILDKLRKALKPIAKDFEARYMLSDSCQCGVVSYSQLRNALLEILGNEISEHEMITVARYYNARCREEIMNKEALRFIVHTDLKRFLFDKFERLLENFEQMDSSRSRYIDRNTAYASCRGAHLPIDKDVLNAVLDKITTNESLQINYMDLMQFLDYKTCPSAPPLPNKHQATFSELSEPPSNVIGFVNYKGLMNDLGFEQQTA